MSAPTPPSLPPIGVVFLVVGVAGTWLFWVLALARFAP